MSYTPPPLCKPRISGAFVNDICTRLGNSIETLSRPDHWYIWYRDPGIIVIIIINVIMIIITTWAAIASSPALMLAVVGGPGHIALLTLRNWFLTQERTMKWHLHGWKQFFARWKAVKRVWENLKKGLKNTWSKHCKDILSKDTAQRKVCEIWFARTRSLKKILNRHQSYFSLHRHFCWN